MLVHHRHKQSLILSSIKITTILQNVAPPNAAGLNLASKSKVPGNRWGPESAEGTVLFVDGVMIHGILDKSQFGASSYGLVHSVYELYGAETAGKLLGVFSRLFTKYLQHRGFTCGMDDLHLTPEGDSWRTSLVAEAGERGLRAALSYVNLGDEDPKRSETQRNLKTRLEEVLRDDTKLAGLDRAMMGEASTLTSSIIEKCLPAGLLKPFPANDMQTMTVSGAKGSNVNVSQISCLLGQQALEGRRVPTMVSGKSLPSFKAYETALRAGGYVAQRFLTGIRPQEYYFHCMAGREGLIDTAVKTSRSGYLQRCLIKHLEGIRVHYDHTVRNSDSSIVQFHYGEDSLDVTRQKHLTQTEFAVRNATALLQRYNPQDAMEVVEADTAASHSKAVLSSLGGLPAQVMQPTLSLYSPSTYLGSVSESFALLVENYSKQNPDRLLKTKKKRRADWPAYIQSSTLMDLDKFKALMNFRYMRSLVDPGEAVGLLASQGFALACTVSRSWLTVHDDDSVGEPSTQMTLNTFHLAGHGAANVTLGIPRLREIVLTASANISTPTMKIPFLSSIVEDKQKSFVKSTTRLNLSQVVDNVVVQERLTSKTAANSYSRKKLYAVTLNLFPPAEYTSEYSTSLLEIASSIETSFLPALTKQIVKERKALVRQAKAQAADIGVGHAAAVARDVAELGEQEEDAPLKTVDMDAAAADGDADDDRRAAQGDQDQNYDDSDNESVLDVEAGAMDEEALEAAFARDGSDDDADEDDDANDPAQSARKSNKKASRPKTKELDELEGRINEAFDYLQKFEVDRHGEWLKFELNVRLLASCPFRILEKLIETACEGSSRAACQSSCSSASWSGCAGRRSSSRSLASRAACTRRRRRRTRKRI